jgi:cell division protein FtsB
MNRSLFKIVLLGLFGVFIYLQYVLWFDADGIVDMVHLKKALAQQSLQNDLIKKQNQALYTQVDRLKHDPEVIEGRARGELGMIKKGEKFYQVHK